MGSVGFRCVRDPTPPHRGVSLVWGIVRVGGSHGWCVGVGCVVFSKWAGTSFYRLVNKLI
jgi:hypothetical protein